MMFLGGNLNSLIYSAVHLHGMKFVHFIIPCIKEMVSCQTDGFVETGHN